MKIAKLGRETLNLAENSGCFWPLGWFWRPDAEGPSIACRSIANRVPEFGITE